MFSSEAQLLKRTPSNGTDRESYLSLLVDEFLHSPSIEAKCQVLANLANFAYDPLNYRYIRDVGVLDIFLHVIKHETNQNLLHFAAAGICNLCIDPLNTEYILTNSGLKPLTELLKSNHADTVADTVTTFIYIFSNDIKALLNMSELVQKMKEIQKFDDKKLSNLATIFLDQVGETSKSP